ncbi:glycosyltransferase [uncultured Microbacterium sp.]|uniref:glycosyltransferase n=1 Tax=uncultured Microbacterium sp. TaxID=191216 RepID=UPI0035CA2F27
MTDQRVRVLFSFRTPSSESNPYVQLLSRALRERAVLLYFGWKTAFFGSYDVFHVHWPETLVRGRSKWRRFVSSVLLAALVCRLRLARVTIVRTLHNVSPHESGSRLESGVLHLLDRATTRWIVLNQDETVDALGIPAYRITAIPHGHFIDWYRPWRDGDNVALSGSLLLFGHVRPYKGVERLIEAFEEIATDSSITLSIAGASHDEALRTQIADAQSRIPGLHAELRFLGDPELTELIERAQLVVLPYERMLNSGAVLTALSLDTPVLVPRNQTNEKLAREVGPSWVQMYEGALTGADLLHAIEATDQRFMRGAPDLRARDWELAADQHLSAYGVLD